jgi:hypothetical protein
MPSRPADLVDEELRRVLADPDVRASLDAYLERERQGELGPGIPHEEVGRRLGLLDEDDETAADAWRGAMAGTTTVSDERDVRWPLDLLAMLPPMNAETNEEFFGQREVDPALNGQEVEQRGAAWWTKYAKVHAEAYGHSGHGRYYPLTC